MQTDAKNMDQLFVQWMIDALKTKELTLTTFIKRCRDQFQDRFTDIINVRMYERWYGTFFELIVMSLLDPCFLSSSWSMSLSPLNVNDKNNRTSWLTVEQAAELLTVTESMVTFDNLDVRYTDYADYTPQETIELMVQHRANELPQHIKDAALQLLDLVNYHTNRKKMRLT